MALSEIFYTFVVKSCCTTLLVIIRMMYKSKCSEVECCCVSIKRDVSTEAQFDENHPSEISDGNATMSV